ncbi:DNA polymerase, beta domain protein region [Candidatus Promineifilum breve]|uniref:DNA polymerase, beta domain protein region n=1 Tax=Candidatus Promineifilum breve TaxID=1806508 RepID=A0A160T2V9_9CHLR|nr:nucleotidyltransferase domain-containing protein [Candidatus Promineifilum breve]CUS04064.2 DNA polymerase, beta domain protein region [Candidatus Promineifilum breve]
MIEELLVEARQQLLDSELERILPLLEEEYAADAVYLFGSAATGDVHQWSDLDLVIIKETDQRFLDRIKDVIELVQPQVGMDIIVYTPQEFGRLSEERPFVREEILAKSKVLCAK